jgi:ribosome-binding factor A
VGGVQDGNRIIRVERLIKKEVADVLVSRVTESGVRDVTVLWVKVSRDLRFADVYVSVYGDEQQVAHGLTALARCRPFVQKEVAARVRLRRTPHIRFRLDKQYRSAVRVFEILKELEADGLPGGGEDSGGN